MRDFAARVAADAGGAAVAERSTALLLTIGPEAAAEVKVQAARIRGSEQDAGRPPLTTLEAARLGRVTDRAIRQACINKKLAGRKDKNTGRWLISRGALAEWETRRAQRSG